MAEEQTQEDPATNVTEAPQPRAKGRRSVKLLGGVAGLIATGSILALMAIPSKEAPVRMTGPMEFSFFGLEDEKKLVANPRDDNFSRYINFEPSCLVFTYDPLYPAARRAEPGFSGSIQEAMRKVVSRYELDQILSNLDEFAEELRRVAEPVLFPVCFGDAQTTYLPDSASGIMAGNSQDVRGTFRGDFHGHALVIDQGAGTLQLGDGPLAPFNGTETDLMIEDAQGRTLFVDVTGLEPDFNGPVPVGVKGRIRRMINCAPIAQ